MFSIFCLYQVKTFVSLLFFPGVCLFIWQLIKAVGLIQYEKEEDEKNYQEWLRKEGFHKTIISILALTALITMWLWTLVNF
jgi:hypothetical protein